MSTPETSTAPIRVTTAPPLPYVQEPRSLYHLTEAQIHFFDENGYLVLKTGLRATCRRGCKRLPNAGLPRANGSAPRRKRERSVKPGPTCCKTSCSPSATTARFSSG